MNKMNKEQKFWFLSSVIGSIVFYGILIMASVYNIRFKYGFHILILAYTYYSILVVGNVCLDSIFPNQRNRLNTGKKNSWMVIKN